MGFKGLSKPIRPTHGVGTKENPGPSHATGQEHIFDPILLPVEKFSATVKTTKHFFGSVKSVRKISL